MRHHYSESYRLVCEAIETGAIEKLGRILSAEERRGIWDAGSLMMLEGIDRQIDAATSAVEVEQILVEGGVAFQERRAQALDIGIQRLKTAVGRPLTVEECNQFQSVETLYEAMDIVERVLEADSQQRALLLKSLLSSSGA
jgi:hypothetical protein